MVTGTTASVSDQIIMTGKAGAPQAFRERAEVFRVPGIFEPRLIKHGLGDRVGHHSTRLALTDSFDRALDRFDRRRGVRWAGEAGRVFNRVFQRDDRQAFRERRSSAGQISLDDRGYETRALGGGAQEARSRQDDERRARCSVAPGSQRQFRTDPGWVAHGHRQRRNVPGHG